MAIADTGRKMHPTISQFKTSLPPSPLSFRSFSLVLSLWCAMLVCATPSSLNIEQCEIECQSTTIAGVSIQGNCKRKCPPGVIPPSQEDQFKKHLDDKIEVRGMKREGDPETQPNKPDHKRRRLQDGETGASGDPSVHVGLAITGDGEYVLKIKRVTPCEGEDKVERAKQMAQNAAVLLLHGEMLRDMAEKLLAQSRELLRSIFRVPAPPIRNSDSRVIRNFHVLFCLTL